MEVADVTAGPFYLPLRQQDGAQDSTLSFRYSGEARMRIDARGLAGVAEVVGAGGDLCREQARSGPGFSCPTSNGSLSVGLVPAKGAKAGARGVLRYSLAASDGSAEGAGAVDVVVGRPELLTSAVDETPTVERGARLTVPVRFANAGDVAARDLVVTVDTGTDLTFVTRHSNCVYADRNTRMFCLLRGIRLPPGDGRTGILRLDPSLRLAPRPHAVDPTVTYTVGLPGPAETEALAGHLPRYRRGKGAPLRAVPDRADSGRELTAHGDEFDVRVPSTADFAAIGDAFTGAVGDERAITIGYVNKGPGQSHRGGTKAVFKVPPGAKVVRAPYDPEPAEEDEPQHCTTGDEGRTYVCGLNNRLGEPQTFEFVLRIEHEDDRSGTISVLRASGEGAVPDPRPDNDRALVRLVVHAAADDGFPAAWASAGGAAFLLATVLALTWRRRRSGR